MLPKRLQKGDTIGVIAPSDPITGEKKEELLQAKAKVEKDGFVVKFSDHIFSNTLGYSATAKERADETLRKRRFL